MKSLKIVFSYLCVVFVVSGCARDLSSSTYTSDSTLSLTLEGKVVSTRPVKIKDTDQLSGNSAGIIAGGLAGGAAGSAVGSGNGQTVAVVGGALAGALIGAVAENALGEQEGIEYIIKVDTSKLKSDYYEGTGAMRQAISSATTSGLITVVQGKDSELVKGQKVYIIFSDKRVRVIPAE